MAAPEAQRVYATCPRCQRQGIDNPSKKAKAGAWGRPRIFFLCPWPGCGHGWSAYEDEARLHSGFLRRAGLLRPMPPLRSGSAAETRRVRGGKRRNK